MKWRHPYRCRKCGGLVYKVHGRRHRRCVVCWPVYTSNYESKHKDDRNTARRLCYQRKREREKKQIAGMTAAYPLDYSVRYPEVDKRHRIKREAAIKAGTVTRIELLAIVERDGGCCIFCGSPVETKCTPSKVRGFDHLFPLLSDEGTHEAWNMAVCCTDCNGRKGQRTFLEYVEDEDIPLSNFRQLPNIHIGLDEDIVFEDDEFFMEVSVDG